MIPIYNNLSQKYHGTSLRPKLELLVQHWRSERLPFLSLETQVRQHYRAQFYSLQMQVIIGVAVNLLTALPASLSPFSLAHRRKTLTTPHTKTKTKENI